MASIERLAGNWRLEAIKGERIPKARLCLLMSTVLNCFPSLLDEGVRFRSGIYVARPSVKELAQILGSIDTGSTSTMWVLECALIVGSARRWRRPVGEIVRYGRAFYTMSDCAVPGFISAWGMGHSTYLPVETSLQLNVCSIASLSARWTTFGYCARKRYVLATSGCRC